MNNLPVDESYLDDAIIFRDTLNPSLWYDGDMKPLVRERLLDMAREFKDFLGIDDLDLLDITVSGSNAAYTYTPHSDVDLHLVARIPEDQHQLYTELFDAKKNLYNLTRNQKIKGFEVEFYVQDANTTVESMGIYSVLRGEWISVPKKVKATVDDVSVKSKVERFSAVLDRVMSEGTLAQARQAWDALKTMRKAGLERSGEFSPENLAFKILRTKGYQKELYSKIIELQDRELSLEALGERAKK